MKQSDQILGVIIGAEENGAAPGAVDGEFDGYAEFVRRYNRSLTAAEISALAELDSRSPP